MAVQVTTKTNVPISHHVNFENPFLVVGSFTPQCGQALASVLTSFLHSRHGFSAIDYVLSFSPGCRVVDMYPHSATASKQRTTNDSQERFSKRAETRRCCSSHIAGTDLLLGLCDQQTCRAKGLSHPPTECPSSRIVDCGPSVRQELILYDGLPNV
jgi:hypothetical protein